MDNSSSTVAETAANTKYRDRLTAEKKDADEIDFTVQQTQLQLDGDILETRRALQKSKKAYEDAKGAKNWNSQNILNLQTEVEGHQEAIKRLTALKEELF